MESIQTPPKPSNHQVYRDSDEFKTPRASNHFKKRLDSPHPKSPRFIANALVNIVTSNLDAKGVKKGERFESIDLERVLTVEKRKYTPWGTLDNQARAVFTRLTQLWNEYPESCDDVIGKEIFDAYIHRKELDVTKLVIPKGKENYSPEVRENPDNSDMKPPTFRPRKNKSARFVDSSFPIHNDTQIELEEKNPPSSFNLLPREITKDEVATKYIPTMRMSAERSENEEPMRHNSPVVPVREAHLNSKGYVYDPEEMQDRLVRLTISKPSQTTPKKRKVEIPEDLPTIIPVFNPLLFDPCETNEQQLARRLSEAWKIFWCNHYLAERPRFHDYSTKPEQGWIPTKY